MVLAYCCFMLWFLKIVLVLSLSRDFVPKVLPLSLESITEATVRFCFKGWQEYRFIDCPYGLLFDQSQDLECLFYFGNLHPRVYRHVCEDPLMISEKQNLDNLPMTQTLEKIVFIDFTNETDGTSQNSDVVDWVDLVTCYQECSNSEEAEILLDSFRDTDSVEEVEDALQIISDETKQKLVEQTLRLGDHLFDKLYTLNLPEVEISSGMELRVFQMFKKTMQILGKICPHPFLHQDYINRVTYGFLFLVKDFGTHTIEDVTIEEYEDIMDALDFCERKGAPFRLEGLVCSTKAMVQNIVKIAEGEELSANVTVSNDTKYKLDKYDLFIESAWRAIDAVHGMCFATFRPNTNMHHRFQRSMEMLFNEKTQERWVNPTELENISDWGLWFLVDIQTTMDNLQQCVKASYEAAPFTMRLDRPIDHRRIRREARGNGLVQNGDENEENVEIATNMELAQVQRDMQDEIWKEYFESGGVTVHLKAYVTCMKTKMQRLETLANLRSTCQIGVDQLL